MQVVWVVPNVPLQLGWRGMSPCWAEGCYWSNHTRLGSSGRKSSHGSRVAPLTLWTWGTVEPKSHYRPLAKCFVSMRWPRDNKTKKWLYIEFKCGAHRAMRASFSTMHLASWTLKSIGWRMCCTEEPCSLAVFQASPAIHIRTHAHTHTHTHF